jgi:predicted RecB family nuclease
MSVVLGTGERAAFRFRDFSSYFRAVRRRFIRAVAANASVTPYPVAHCALCSYIHHCESHWHDTDHLSLVAGIRRSQFDHLSDLGIATCGNFAVYTGPSGGIGLSAFDRIRHQASLQTYFRTTGEHRYDLLPPGDENGFRLLPTPSDGDVFFDMEGFPFFDADGGLEYLFGAIIVDGGSERFQAFRATDRAGEKRAFEAFVDFLWDRMRQWPDLHVYHYGAYEPTTLKRLMTEHATREEEVDELLRREAFVDLYKVVRRSMRISHESYSIKAVRQFFMSSAGQGGVADGGESMVEFQRFLDTGDSSILDAIERYNEEDCVSTFRLRDWLLERRTDAEREFTVTIPFRQLPDRRSEPVEVEPDGHANLRARLTARAAPWATLLGHLLDYHRREAKPEWWAYFDRRMNSLDELLDDTEAIAYLAPTGAPPERKAQSLVFTLAFPAQEFKLKVDTHVDGAFNEGGVGTIEWIDASGGRLGLRRGKKRADDPLPQAVIAGRPVPDTAQRDAIVRVAAAAASATSSYQATYHRWARRDQVEKCYPQMKEFLALKRQHDPEERFQSTWYRRYREMFA